MTKTYGEVRAQATEEAWKHIRHLLYPETVHLLSINDLQAAISIACDILAPAETDAAERLPRLLRELDLQRREHLRVLDERDDAVRAANDLAYGIAALTGEDIGKHRGDNNPWQRALDLLDAVAEANNRPRPSDLRYRAA